jgi:hypothetical protein
MVLPGYALIAQGTQIHAATWPGSERGAAPPAPMSTWPRQLLLSRALAAQAACYVICVAGSAADGVDSVAPPRRCWMSMSRTGTARSPVHSQPDMLKPHGNLKGDAKETTCIQSRARPEARSRTKHPRCHFQPDHFRRWRQDRGSATTNRTSGAIQCAHESMINRCFLIVPPTLLDSGYAEMLLKKRRQTFLLAT